MRFKLGLALGVAAGYWMASRADEERRAQIDQTVQRILDNPRLRHIGETVSRDARRIGDAVEQRLVTGADGATEAIAGTVGGESSTGSSGAEGGSSTSSGSGRGTANRSTAG